MCLRLISIAFVASLMGSSVFAQQEANTQVLGRLPILSRTILVDNAVSPTDLTVENPRTVPCLDGERTINSRTPWIWCYDVNRITEFVQPHIQLRGFPNDNSWYLSVNTESGREIDRLNASSFRWISQGPGDLSIAERWSEAVPGQKIQIELHTPTKPRELRVSIDRVNISFFRPGQKAITTGKNDMRDLLQAVNRSHKYYNYSRSIAIVRLMMPDGSDRWTNCTGFLLTQNLLMTNQHCISEPRQLDTAYALFGFESEPPAPTEQDRIPFTKIEFQDPKLDFSILRLKWPARDNWRPAVIDVGPIAKSQQLLLIQHPDNQPKVLSLIECTIKEVKVGDLPEYSNDFYHLCDCAGGSSGAPMIDEKTGRVVGLQHREIRKIGDDGINLAVRIDEIIKKIPKDTALLNEIRAQMQLMQH